jgi:hypothetical protein
MLAYFLSEIEVRVRFIRTSGLVTGEAAKLLDEIDTGLRDLRRRLPTVTAADSPAAEEARPSDAQDDAWNQAYKLERLLALAEPAANLPSEIRRRLDQTREEGIASATRLRAAFDSTAALLIDTASAPPKLKEGAEPILRGLLLETLEELHWASQRKFASRPIQKKATRVIAGFGLLSCVLFVVPYVCIGATHGRVADKAVIPVAAWLPLYTAAAAGFFGAMFSRLMSLQANMNTLSLGALGEAKSVLAIFFRGSVGVTGALFAYFFFLSGIMGGSLLPDFDKMTVEGRSGLPVPNTQLALLAVWSFLAGFSERLVPNILQKTETRLMEVQVRR